MQNYYRNCFFVILNDFVKFNIFVIIVNKKKFDFVKFDESLNVLFVCFFVLNFNFNLIRSWF